MLRFVGSADCKPLAALSLNFVFSMAWPICGRDTTFRKGAASEDRTHDLRIMRPTRCQLRYSRLKIIVIRARMRLRWPCDLLLTIRTARLARVFEFASTLRRNVHYRTIAALLKDTLYTVWRRGSAAEPLQKQIVVASSIDAARACEWRRQQQAAWPRSCGS